MNHFTAKLFYQIILDLTICKNAKRVVFGVFNKINLVNFFYGPTKKSWLAVK